MSARDDLLRNLRRADQRRRRKPNVSLPPPTVQVSQEMTWFAELLVRLFTQMPYLTDRKVVAAIESVVLDRKSTDRETLVVRTEISQLLEKEGVDRQVLLKEIKKVATTIKTDYLSSTPQAYLQYLQVLAE
jgi:hypothetical protein